MLASSDQLTFGAVDVLDKKAIKEDGGFNRGQDLTLLACQ